MHLATLDFTVVAIYAVVLLFIAQWVSREKSGHEKNTKDYFLYMRGASIAAGRTSLEAQFRQ